MSKIKRYGKEEDDFIVENFEKMSQVEIAKILNRSIGSVRQRCSRLKIKNYTPNNTPLSDHEVDFILKNYNILTNTEICNRLNIKPSKLNHIRRKYGIEKPQHKIYNVDENYFETIDSPTKAYWVGFIFADGCIASKESSRGGKVLRIGLKSTDKKHLELFREDLKSDVPIVYRTNRIRDKEYQSVNIAINRTKLCEDLIRVNVVQNKTYKNHIPDIPKDYYTDFVRGFVDGDGGFYLGYSEKYNRYRYSVDLTAYGKEFFIELQKWLTGNGIKSYIYEQKNKYKLTISNKKDILTFINLLYYSDDIRCLYRKREKAMEIKKLFTNIKSVPSSTEM